MYKKILAGLQIGLLALPSFSYGFTAPDEELIVEDNPIEEIISLEITSPSEDLEEVSVFLDEDTIFTASYTGSTDDNVDWAVRDTCDNTSVGTFAGNVAGFNDPFVIDNSVIVMSTSLLSGLEEGQYCLIVNPNGNSDEIRKTREFLLTGDITPEITFAGGQDLVIELGLDNTIEDIVIEADGGENFTANNERGGSATISLSGTFTPTGTTTKQDISFTVSDIETVSGNVSFPFVNLLSAETPLIEGEFDLVATVLNQNGFSDEQSIIVSVMNEVPQIQYAQGQDVEITAKDYQALLTQLELMGNEGDYVVANDDKATTTIVVNLSDEGAVLLGTSSVTTVTETQGDVESDINELLAAFTGGVVATGTHTIEVSIVDSIGQIAEQTITINIQNTAPVIEYNGGENLEVTAKTKQALIDQLVAIDPAYLISDFDNEPIFGTTTATLSDAASLLAGTSTIVVPFSSEGNAQLDLAIDFANLIGEDLATGTYTFFVEATDGEGPDSEVSQTLTINIQNTAPIIEYNDGEDLEVTVKDLSALTAQLTTSTSDYVISDFDGDTVSGTSTITLSDAAAAIAGTSTLILNLTGDTDIEEDIAAHLALVPGGEIATGTYTIVIEANDGEEDASNGPQTITINIQNTAPVIEYNDGEDLEIVVKDITDLLAALTASTTDFVISDFDKDSIQATSTLTLPEGLEIQDQNEIEFAYSSNQEDGSTIGVVIEEFVSGLVASSGDGSILGTYTLVTQVTDGEDDVVEQLIQVTITGETKPEFVSFEGATSTSVLFTFGDTIEIPTLAIDEDGDEVRYFLSSDSDEAFVVDSEKGLITTASSSDLAIGQYVITVLVNDAGGSAEVIDLIQDEDFDEEFDQIILEVEQIDDYQEIIITVEEQEEEVEQPTRSGGGGSRFVCKDRDALNYKSSGKSDPRLCKYADAKDEPEESNELEEDTGNSTPTTDNENPQIVPAPVPNSSNTNNQIASNISDVVIEEEQEEELVEQGESEGSDEQEEIAVASQSANILSALTSGDAKGCTLVFNKWTWFGFLALLFLLGGLIRFFAYPTSSLYRLSNSKGALTLTGLAVLALWLITDPCWSLWVIPVTVMVMWALAIFTRDTSV